MRKKTERTASCFPETLSFQQRFPESCSVLGSAEKSQALSWSGASKKGARDPGPAKSILRPSFLPSRRTLAILSVPTPLSSPLGVPRSLPTPNRRRRPAPPSVPPLPRGALDSPGCHVSLMTSPGPLGLSQSARGSPSEVLASESEGRGAGRGGGGRGESGEWGGRHPLKYASARGAGLGGKPSPGLRAAPSVPSAHTRSSNSLSRHARRCGRPLGCVKALRTRAFLFPGSLAAILGGIGS